MKLITERTMIRDAASNWAVQYSGGQHGEDKREIGRQLAKLNGETATSADVAAIIGNDGWTKVRGCDECGDEHPEAVVQLGQEPDYESRTAWICAACIWRAAAFLPAREKEPR